MGQDGSPASLFDPRKGKGTVSVHELGRDFREKVGIDPCTDPPPVMFDVVERVHRTKSSTAVWIRALLLGCFFFLCVFGYGALLFLGSVYEVEFELENGLITKDFIFGVTVLVLLFLLICCCLWWSLRDWDGIPQNRTARLHFRGTRMEFEFFRQDSAGIQKSLRNVHNLTNPPTILHQGRRTIVVLFSFTDGEEYYCILSTASSSESERNDALIDIQHITHSWVYHTQEKERPSSPKEESPIVPSGQECSPTPPEKVQEPNDTPDQDSSLHPKVAEDGVFVSNGPRNQPASSMIVINKSSPKRHRRSQSSRPVSHSGRSHSEDRPSFLPPINTNDLLSGLRAEKRQLQRVLYHFEQEFEHEMGRKISTKERIPMADSYRRYKTLKLQLLELEKSSQREATPPT